MTMLIPIRDHNPGHRFPLVTLTLIAVNVYVFLAYGVTEETIFRFGAVPCDVLGRCPAFSEELARAFPDRGSLASVVTSMFMHGNLLHLGGNMLFLWVFGNNVEDQFGKIGFALFYMVTGLGAALAHFAIASGSSIPIVGASGAVSGVLGAYFYLYPRARVVALVPFLFFFPVTVSAKFMLGFWFVMQLLGGIGGLGAVQQEGGVAFMAHVGGFVAGYFITRVVHPQRAAPAPVRVYRG